MRTRVGLLSPLGGIYLGLRSNTLFRLNGTRIIPVLVPYCFTIKLVNYGVLNNHWQSDLQLRYNDARLELSQQKLNATLIAALKTTAAA